jgi:archaeal flagellar protein FlaF
MAVAEIIGAAVGVLLLVIVAYLLVGGTLSTAETVVSAQKDITQLQEIRLRTHITIDSATRNDTAITFSVTNNGDETISDISKIDIFSYNSTKSEYIHYRYNNVKSYTEETWYDTSFENDVVHASQLDPGVTMHGEAVLMSGDSPYNIRIITPNGISAERLIP